MNKRSLLKIFGGVCSLCLGSSSSKINLSGAFAEDAPLTPFPAQYFDQLENGKTLCRLCPNACLKGNGERSKCRVRETRDGKLFSLVHSAPCVLSLDPLEKCPLFHFKIGENALSIATAGCNLSCAYCQNWQFSQKRPEETQNFKLPPEEVVQKAIEYKASTIAFFYTEPTVAFEYIKDIAIAAKKQKLFTVMVTAGYINEKPLRDISEYVDGFTVGLKGFSPKYYQEVVGGQVTPVLKTLQTLFSLKKHVEVVTLLVPTLNDNPDDIKKGVQWMVKTLGPDVPLHFSRFSPQFQLKRLPPTPSQTLEKARKLGMEAGMHYVYTGNVPGHEGNHTYCPKCKTALIERLGFQIKKNILDKGKCPTCQTRIPGLWNL